MPPRTMLYLEPRLETVRLLVQDLLQSQAIHLNQGELKTLLNGLVWFLRLQAELLCGVGDIQESG